MEAKITTLLLNHFIYYFSINNQNRNFETQKGFTLIELLVVLGIIGILSASSLIAIKQTKESVFKGLADKLIVEARTSLEAGQINSDNLISTGSYLATWKKGALVSSSSALDNWIPGFSNPGNFDVSVTYSGESLVCEVCTMYTIYARHCGGAVSKTQILLSDGTLMESYAQESEAC
jgi:prepilin-type N-terminal cleavage/methylation domain-containing protein